jgi:hypothetical protein
MLTMIFPSHSRSPGPSRATVETSSRFTVLTACGCSCLFCSSLTFVSTNKKLQIIDKVKSRSLWRIR